MTPEPPPPQPSSSRFWIGLLAGFFGAVVLLGLCGGLAGFTYMKKANQDARKGWNLVPVIVAAQDIPAGTSLTMDLISQRSMPEQFVTDSVVKPDDASSIINRKVLVPMKAKDPMLWSHFQAEPE